MNNQEENKEDLSVKANYVYIAEYRENFINKIKVLEITKKSILYLDLDSFKHFRRSFRYFMENYLILENHGEQLPEGEARSAVLDELRKYMLVPEGMLELNNTKPEEAPKKTLASKKQ